ncbi:MAG: sigma-54-dependent Fis family transcriptional regulator [Myxococcales bacterium]|nr:sigma-54-dependent Fis family transcriptional regulator [Myxococcales bacterium]
MRGDLAGLELWVVEDHASTRRALAEIGASLGATVRDFASAELALAEPEAEPDLVVTDLRLPGIDGIRLLEELARRRNPPEGVVLTAHGSVDDAVRAMRAGAADFLTKPIDVPRVEAVLRGVAGRASLRAELRAVRDENRRLRGHGDPPVFRSAAMRRIVEEVRRAASSDATVLLVGESGTGKERLARMVHDASARRARPFVAGHLAALGEGVIESELFGHERGAFTGAVGRRAGLFEQAHGGTLFLDEIGEIDARTQVRLLRVLQERAVVRVGGTTTVPVDVRLVGATHQDLDALVREGRFREDLLYRLDVVRLVVPPLRDRRDDIPLLTAHFADLYARRYGRPVPELEPEVVAALAAWSWPGNVRELENAVQRMVVMGPARIGLRDLPGRIATPEPAERSLPEGDIDLPTLVDDFERALVTRAMERAGHNKAAAARSLGITREGLRYKLQKLGIDD